MRDFLTKHLKILIKLKVFDPGDKKIGVPVLDQGIGLISTLTDGKKTKWPRLSIETKII